MLECKRGEALTDCVDSESGNTALEPEANCIFVDCLAALLDLPVQFGLLREEGVEVVLLGFEVRRSEERRKQYRMKRRVKTQ